jgi:hypothetical protein
MSNIKSIIPIGKHQTYDLEVDHPDHQFYLANGVLTSNSHAVAYAIDSFWTSWFMTYHTDEWLCAYLESMSNSPDRKAKAFGEAKALGYTIVPIDINLAGKGWIALPGKRLMPSMLSCKGVGESAIDEIIEKRPYDSIEELLWDDEFNWKHSKFNKKALEALIKIGAFDSMGIVGKDKIFKNYRHMHEVLCGSHIESVTRKRKGIMVTEDVDIEHAALVKRHPKSDPHEGLKNFYELVRTCADVPDWTPSERAENMIEVFGAVDVATMIDPRLLDALTSRGINSIDEIEMGESKVIWFVVMPTSPKKGVKPVAGIKRKTKNGKDYVQVFGAGPVGKAHRISVWGCKEIPEAFTAFCAEVKRDDYGMSTTVWKMKELS